MLRNRKISFLESLRAALFLGVALPILTLIVTSYPAYATNYYVSPTGSGSACTLAAPCALTAIDGIITVGSPAVCASADGKYTASNVGACIHGLSGTYPATTLDTNKSGTSTAHIRYICDTQWSCKTRAQWGTHGTFNDIVGWELDGTGLPGVVNGMVAYPGDTLILGNKVHDVASGCNSSNTAVIESAAPHTLGHGNIFDGNFVYHNNCGATGSSSNGNSNAGISMHSFDIARNNIIVDQGGGFCLQVSHTADHNVVTNNTILNCGRGGIVVGFLSGGSGDYITISDNIIGHGGVATGGGNGGLDIASDGCGAHSVFQNNLMYANTANGGTNILGSGTPCAAVSGTITTGTDATIFVNYSGTSTGDYHLKAGSPAIGAGVSTCASGVTGCISSVDFAGAVRPVSGAQDVGAYVFSTGSAPIVSFNPSPLDFGAVPVSTTANAVAQLRNTGTADLTFTPASISGTNATDFRIVSTTCTSPLSAGLSCTYNLSFTPQATGARSANLTLSDNASGSPHQLPLTGTGGSPAITLTPPSQNFGTVPVGSTSAVQTTTLTSSGSTSLTITAPFTLTGTNPGDFTSGGTCTLSPMAPGSTCAINFTFKPTAAGTRSATLTIQDTASGSPHLVPLTGTGGAPAVSLTPASFDFGSVQVGTASSAQVFALSNTGGAPLTFTISTSSGIFVQSNTCTSPLAPAGSCNISVTFQPTAGGAQSGLLTVTSNAASSPNTSTLTGTGVTPAGLTLSPSTLNFVNTNINSYSAVTNITVSNPNAVAVTLSGVTVTGTNASEFIAGACSTSTNAFTDNFNGGSLDLSKWQIDTGGAPGTIGGVNTGSFSSSNVDLSQGVLALKVTQTGAAPVTSVGAEVRAVNSLGFGNYRWKMRAASTATSPFGTGSAVSGQISSSFLLNSSTANPYTEIDAPEIEGRTPNTLEWTSWTTTSTNTSVSTALTNPEAAFHTYRFDWQSSSIVFLLDGTSVATNTTNIPSAAGNPMVNLWGTNSSSFGGTATTGTTRWIYVSGFAFTPSGGGSIPAGGSCTVPVFFAPTSTGSKTATVSIADSATGSPHQATLGGLATAPAAAVTGGPLNFGSQTTGTTSGTQNLTLANTGNGPMWFTVALAGTNPGDFLLGATSCVSPLAGGQSCLIGVQFKPTTTGARTATVSVTDSASGSPHTGTVNGTGTAASSAVCLSTSSVSFGNQPVNTSSGTSPVNVTNCGSANLVVSSVNSAATNLDMFADAVAPCPATATWCGVHDDGTPGTAVGTTQLVASPSIDGQSRQFVSTFTAAGGLRWHLPFNRDPSLGLDPNSTAYAYDTQVWVQDTTHVNQLEFDMNQVIPNGDTVIYATQCNFVAGFWQYTTNSSWHSSNIPCTKGGWSSAAWHHLIVKYHRDSIGIVTYDSVTFDGTTTAFINASGSSHPSLGWSPIGLNLLNFQMNGDNTSNTITAYLDQTSISTTNFSQTNNCATVTPGNFCTINGMFSPTFVGSIAGRFRVVSNAASSPDAIDLSGFGTQVGGTLTPTSVDFGNATVGFPTAATPLIFTNTGSSSVTLAAPTLSGTNASDFSASSACGTVAVNATCSINVVFTPSNTGARTATLTQMVGSLALTVSLTGTGVAAVPAVQLSPTTIDFGNVAVSSPSTVHTIQLTNTGQASLTISSVAATGTNAGDFTVTNHCPGSVLAGGVCTIDALCTPSNIGTRSGAVTITDNASDSPQAVSLTCNGTVSAAPRVTAPSSLAFPSTQVGLTSAAQVISITNNGNSSLVFSSITLSGTNSGDFVIALGTTCTTVSPGANCAITLNFVPTAAGSRSATLNLIDNASDSPQAVSLSGTAFTGTPSLLVPISTIDFGNLVVGTVSSPVVFSLTNQGTATATVTITATSDFNTSNTCGGSILASASCTITVQFAPTILCGQFGPGQSCVSNVHTGTLSIVSNSAASPQTVTLQGTALAQTPPPGPVVIGMGGKTGTGGNTQQGIH
jgi:hypothetical protein